MIDPSSIISIIPANNTQLIKMKEIPECETEVYNIYDDKDFKRFIQDIEREVRGSFEYRRFVWYLKNYCGMNKCAILDIEADENKKVKIEIHHYPFTLYDICLVVFNKRLYYKESIELEMVAKEVMELHYKGMVGLISLSTTIHKLNHNKYIFVPVDKVFGRYNLFVESYKEFMLPEFLDVLSRIEEYSNDMIRHGINYNILNPSKVFLELSGTYKLPDLSGTADAMFQRITTIKENGYRLPILEESEDNTPKIDNRQRHSAIRFF